MLTIIQKLLIAFITLIVGLVLVGQIASDTQDKAALSNQADTLDITNGLSLITTTEVNVTHGTTFTDGLSGTFVFPTVILADGKNLSCTKPIIINDSGNVPIAEGNWSWSTTSQARGRCGISFNATTKPGAEFNNSRWNFSYIVTYQDINMSYQYTISQVPTGWKVDQCPITSINLYNTTTPVAAALLTLNADYKYAPVTGKINLTGSAVNNFSTSYSYSAIYGYCGDDYIIGWGGTVLLLIPGFFALAILIFSVGMFYSIAKDTGII